MSFQATHVHALRTGHQRLGLQGHGFHRRPVWQAEATLGLLRQPRGMLVASWVTRASVWMGGTWGAT